jgi:hypothetical protein
VKDFFWRRRWEVKGREIIGASGGVDGREDGGTSHYRRGEFDGEDDVWHAGSACRHPTFAGRRLRSYSSIAILIPVAAKESIVREFIPFSSAMKGPSSEGRDWWQALQDIQADQERRGFVGTVTEIDGGDEGYDARMRAIYENTTPPPAST